MSYSDLFQTDVLNSDFYSESLNIDSLGFQCEHDEIGTDAHCIKCGTYVMFMHSDSVYGYCESVDDTRSESVKSTESIDSCTSVDSHTESTNGAVKGKTQRESKVSLSKKFFTLNIDEKVKNKAIQISEQMCFNTPKSKKKALLDFFCLYEAYKSFNIQKDPFYVAETVGLEAKYVNKALTAFSETQTAYHSTFHIVSPLDLIDDYSGRLKFDSYKQEDCREFAKKILNSDKRLLDEMPRKVVSAILKFYMVVNGIVYDKTEFEKAVGFSETTLNIIYKRISNLY